MEIAIPRKDFMNSQQKFEETEKPQTKVQEKEQMPVLVTAPVQTQEQSHQPPQETGYFYHKVQSGESLSSIAERYGLTLRELRKANRDLRFPQVGDYVKVPGMKAPEKPEIKPVTVDTVIVCCRGSVKKDGETCRIHPC